MQYSSFGGFRVLNPNYDVTPHFYYDDPATLDKNKFLSHVQNRCTKLLISRKQK